MHFISPPIYSLSVIFVCPSGCSLDYKLPKAIWIVNALCSSYLKCFCSQTFGMFGWIKEWWNEYFQVELFSIYIMSNIFKLCRHDCWRIFQGLTCILEEKSQFWFSGKSTRSTSNLNLVLVHLYHIFATATTIRLLPYVILIMVRMYYWELLVQCIYCRNGSPC